MNYRKPIRNRRKIELLDRSFSSQKNYFSPGISISGDFLGLPILNIPAFSTLQQRQEIQGTDKVGQGSSGGRRTYFVINNHCVTGGGQGGPGRKENLL